MQKGDWIELRDAPNTRGIVKRVHCRGPAPGCCKFHELVHEEDPVVTMLLSGDRGGLLHVPVVGVPAGLGAREAPERVGTGPAERGLDDPRLHPRPRRGSLHGASAGGVRTVGTMVDSKPCRSGDIPLPARLT